MNAPEQTTGWGSIQRWRWLSLLQTATILVLIAELLWRGYVR